MAYQEGLDFGIDNVKAAFTMATFARLLGLWVAYQVAVALYNISPLHPLSCFPGPKLAAMTMAYEGWFDLIKVGRYSREIRKMHEKYGPIVRINPSELHCNDPAFIDEIYAVGGRKRNKTTRFVRSFVSSLSEVGFTTVDHDLHRVRRAPMSRHFSRQQMLKLEPEIYHQLQFFCDKLLSSERNEPFEVTMAFSCFTSDVISGYSFGEPLGLLTQEGWEPNWRQATYAMLNVTFIFRYMPILRGLAKFGIFFARGGWMGPDMEMLMNTLHVRIPSMITKTRKDADSGMLHGKNALYLDLLDSNTLPESEKTLERLSAEGMTLMNAGTETTAWVLSVITFYVLSRPEILRRLTTELTEGIPDARKLSWASLEQLPYLGGVILEGLRLSYGLSARIARIAPDEDLVYRGEFKGKRMEYVIPRGWAVGMSSAVMNHNDDVFPDSDAFIPERWFDDDGNRRRDMEKCLLSFGKGSRQCLGMNLAYCELYLAVATLALRVFPRMTLFETTEEDVKYDHDLFVPMTKSDSQGVRVIIS